jgi:hypothetical protein
MSFLNRWSKTEHQWVEESLSAYMDGELSPADQARVKKHLQECKSCTEHLQELRQTVRLVRQLPVIPAPRSFAVRPVVTGAKPARTARSWGYGVLKGATAIAALLLMLLVGGDVALHVVGGPVRSLAPAAQAPEAAWAPTLEPSVAPPATEEETMLGQAKETEPSNLEQAVPAPSEATQQADAYFAPTSEASSPPRVEGATPLSTPTAGAQPTEIPAEEGAPLGAGEAEPTPPLEGAPTLTPEPEMEGPSEPPAPAPSPHEGERAAVSPASPTPEVVAMAEQARRDEADRGGPVQEGVVFALSPLRLGELVALAIVLVLAAATALTAWLRRRTG